MIDEFINGIDMRGHAKIELFEDGKLVSMVEKDNFIGIAGRRWLLACALISLRSYITGNDASKLEGFAPQDVFSRFKLTDNASAVDPSAKTIPGNMVGYAGQQAYSGSDTQKGTININESLLSENQLKLVFDWPTSAANGTFQTVGFDNANGYDAPFLVANYGNGAYYYTGICVDGVGNMYFNCSGYMYKYNFASGIKTKLGATSLGSGYSYGLAYYNNKIYITGQGGSINQPVYVFDLATNTCSTFKASVSTQIGYGIACDGTYFYTWDSASNYIIRYDLNFNIVSSKAAYTNGISFNYMSIVNPGWIMNQQGWEINIADLFAATSVITKRQNIILNGGGQIVSDGTNYYSFKSSLFIPSLYNYGTAQGYASASGSFASNNVMGTNPIGICRIDNQTIGSCVVLQNPITKLYTQTMKITYTFNFSV